MHCNKKLFALLGSFIILNAAALGCSPVEKSVKLLVGSEQKESNKVTLEPLEKTGEQQNGNAEPQKTQLGSDQAEMGTVQQSAATEKIKVVLYFGKKDGSALVGEIREIKKVPGLARSTVEELLKGPSPDSGLLQTIPQGVKLQDIKLTPDGIAVVSFSHEIKEQHSGGSCGENLSVYSIVNTLTQFASIQKVQILIDNQAVETLAGHLDLTQPLERNAELIKAK